MIRSMGLIHGDRHLFAYFLTDVVDLAVICKENTAYGYETAEERRQIARGLQSYFLKRGGGVGPMYSLDAS